MAENVIDLATARAAKDHGGWMAGDARCLACGHLWTSVAPVGTFELECPKCLTWQGVFKYPAARPSEPVLTCECGCQLMLLHQDGEVRCYRCGARQSAHLES